MSTAAISSFKTDDLRDSNTESKVYSFTFIEPHLQTDQMGNSYYTTVHTSGCISIGKQAGNPMMPVKSVKLLIPSMNIVTDVDVIGTPIEIELDVNLKEKPVSPYQSPVPIGYEPQEFKINTDIYSSDLMYPSNIYDGYRIGYCRGYAIMDITLNPVQYIPSEGRLFYYPELIVTIELEETGYVNQFFRNNPDDKAWVEILVYNPDITDTYTVDLPTFEYPGGLCDPSDNYDYVIVTTTKNGLDYWSTSGSTPYNWESLMDKHDDDDNLRCTLVTIQDITACTDYHNTTPLFNDLRAHIREFCKDAYQDWGIDYVFIGGDAEWIPARLMDSDVESKVDADIYWNHLDSTFNEDHDNDWGEEGDPGFDLYAELFIGRITCDTSQDVSNWMTKSFYYADSGDIDYFDNAAFYGGNTGWACQGDDFIDYSAIKGTDRWLGPSPSPHPSWLGFQYGFETWNAENPGNEYNMSVAWTAEPPNPGWKGGSGPAAITGLKNAINNDHVAIISGMAHATQHASYDVPSGSWESDYHNTKPFFIHDYGCHCGDMDATDDGVLHSMLFHSDTELAFACVYNTGFGWGNLYSTKSSSALQQKLFWAYMFDVTNNSGSSMNWQLGKAMAHSRDTMAPTIDWGGSWREIIQCCLLFGDPAQRIKPPYLDTCPPVTNISFDGLLGENNWYISSGNVTFNATDDLYGVDETYYQLNGGSWETYTNPFPLSDEGMNLINFYSIDIAGNQEDIQSVCIKNDYALPVVRLTKQKISFNEVLFTAHIIDDISGPGWSEFYLDGELQSTDISAPYEWMWYGMENHEVKVVGYDMAGLSSEDIGSTFHSSVFLFLQRYFPRLFLIINNIVEAKI